MSVTSPNAGGKRVLVIGASRGIGLQTVKTALGRGYRVRAFARSAERITLQDARLETVSGDARGAGDLRRALDGVDAVVLTLGISLRALLSPVSLFSDATQALVSAMQPSSVRRLIAVTGFGAGDSRAAINVLQRLPFHAVFGRAYDDKDRQESIVKQSGLDWTLVRPGVLLDAPATKRYRVLVEPSTWRNGIIARADVADFLVRQVEDRTLIHAAPVIVL